MSDLTEPRIPAVTAPPPIQRLPLLQLILVGLQHVLLMYGGAVAVPLIIGQAAGLSSADVGLLIAASLFAGGLATLLQTLGLPFFGCQLPLVQGVSFAGVATMITKCSTLITSSPSLST